MDRVANWVLVSWGWRRRMAAFAAGAASSLAQPPFFLFPLLWLTFPVFVWLLDGAVPGERHGGLRRLWPAFAAGWWFGFGYFLAGLWWVGSAFLVEAEEFGWMMPLAVVALPAGLALFWGLGAAVARLFWSAGWHRVFALAFGLAAAEWLRGHVLTGFPWNAIGYALTAGEVLMQSAALFGVDALSALAVLVFAAPATVWPADGDGRRHLWLPSLALLGVAALALFGFLRLAQADAESVSGTMLRIVQPAIDQAEKWRPENKDSIFRSYLDLSRTGGPMPPGTVLVWPESAFPFALTEEPAAIAAIADLLPPQTTLVTGAARIDRSAGRRRVFNSIYVIDDSGVIQAAYDKVHLVPFGEYLPFQETLEALGLRQLTKMRGGFSAGPSRQPMALPSAPAFAPLICYEIVFSGAVLPQGPRPGFLLNVTNDAWFGRTIGPYQHLHQARVRAVEEGLPLVRAANTGISTVADAYGRLLARSRLGEPAVFDAPLPAATTPPPYARFRSGIVAVLLAGIALVAIFGSLHPVRRR